MKSKNALQKKMKNAARKLRLAAFATACILLLTACAGGSKESSHPLHIAVVSDLKKLEDSSFNVGVWSGAQRYARANGCSLDCYLPKSEDEAGWEAAIRAAAEKGADVVICPGSQFSLPIYNLQREYSDLSFLQVDGEPNNGQAIPIYETAANTHCILYREEQAGYLAGYAAVMDGYRKLGFLGGPELLQPIVRFGYGFIQGAEAVGQALGLSSDDVEIQYWYSGSLTADDAIREHMSAWYEEGTEVVFACGGEIVLSCIDAAEEKDCKVIGVDIDQSDLSSCVLTSATKKLEDSVWDALADLADNGGAWSAERSGTAVVLGAAEGGVGLPTGSDSWRFENFTAEQYRGLLADLSDGTLQVSDRTGEMLETAVCTVEYQ